MAKSQNGWTAGTPAQIGGLDNSYVPGTKVKLAPGVRSGDVATVLFYVARRFHAEVEPLHAGWCWGYAYRNVRGGGDLSNHASGTAIDVNAPKHPLGTNPSSNYTAKQIAAIHKIIDDCEGVVRFGGDYTGRKDPMHFEIVKNAAAVKALAAKIKAGTVGKPTVPTKPAPPTKPGGPAPYRPNLKVDGDLGPATIKALQHVLGTQQDGKISDPSEMVKALQRFLNAHGASPKLTVDGTGLKQDGRVYKTVRALQRYLGVLADGKLSHPVSDCVKALQKRLNTGKL